jgi:hypothetical protein
MSWYNETWTKRLPITFYQPSAAAASTVDLTGTFPTDYDFFWDAVETNGGDIRITDSDGLTLISLAAGNANGWDLGASAFSTSTRTFAPRIDGWTGAPAVNNAICQLFLYFDAGTQTGTADGAIALASQRTLYYPQFDKRTSKRVVVREEVPGTTTPRQDFQKFVGEEILVAWDFSQLLMKRARPFEGKLLYEEIDYAEIDAGQTVTSDATLYDVSLSRIIPGNTVLALYKGGTTGSNYWIECRVVTTAGRTLIGRANMRVRNVTQVA